MRKCYYLCTAPSRMSPQHVQHPPAFAFSSVHSRISSLPAQSGPLSAPGWGSLCTPETHQTISPILLTPHHPPRGLFLDVQEKWRTEGSLMVGISPSGVYTGWDTTCSLQVGTSREHNQGVLCQSRQGPQHSEVLHGRGRHL